MSKYIMDINGDEIYWDNEAQELVMVGELGEHRVNLSSKLQGANAEERDLIIRANIVHCMWEYCQEQLGYNDSVIMREVEFEYDPDSKLVKEADPVSNGDKKKTELN